LQRNSATVSRCLVLCNATRLNSAKLFAVGLPTTVSDGLKRKKPMRRDDIVASGCCGTKSLASVVVARRRPTRVRPPSDVNKFLSFSCHRGPEEIVSVQVTQSSRELGRCVRVCATRGSRRRQQRQHNDDGSRRNTSFPSVEFHVTSRTCRSTLAATRPTGRTLDVDDKW